MTLTIAPAFAADGLRLRNGISFDQDVDSGFPIMADRMDDVAIEPNRAAFIFFGASGDLNTNRQARRIVDLYKKLRGAPVKFIIIDVDHPASPGCKQLIKEHYQGYIPSELLIDKLGKKVWSSTGEADLKPVEKLAQ